MHRLTDCWTGSGPSASCGSECFFSCGTCSTSPMRSRIPARCSRAARSHPSRWRSSRAPVTGLTGECRYCRSRVFDSSFDEPLLGSLYDRHRDELVRYAARFTGDADLAADVVQETFLRLTRRPPEDLLAVRTWLFRVATTIALDMMRVQRRRANLSAVHSGRLPRADAAPDPAEHAAREDLRRRVREVLDQMDPRDRAVLLMREEGF